MNDSGEGLTINLDIDEALQQGALTVYYQPVFDISTAHPILVEAEALVRWNHPKLGMLTPTDFAIWHTSERITTNLTEYVLQHLVEQQVAWKKQNLTLPVAVNMSVAMISGDGFSQRLAVLLDEHRVDHASLILELVTRFAPLIWEKIFEASLFAVKSDHFLNLKSGYGLLCLL